jgi:alpha-glucosidase (family GH31 glycosyl hydrolase)
LLEGLGDETDGLDMSADVQTRSLELLPGEWWWGGAVVDGQAMPFGRAVHRRNLATSAGFGDDESGGSNQSAPFLVSSAGRYVWSERPFTFAFDGGRLQLAGYDMMITEAGGTLASAFQTAASRHFPASGRTPGTLMFTAPQYNTWIEMPYRPTQEAVLGYARGVLAAGLPPGVIMVDDRWSADYGEWTFDRVRFPEPGEMTHELDELGFSLMLWLVPFLSPDGENSRMATKRGWLITGPDGRPVVREWWNGYSTVLDLTNPEGVAWLRQQLNALRSTYSVVGFKFDAGDLHHYRQDDVTMGGDGAVGQCEAWARLAAEFEFNEMRACWKMGGQPLAQRLHDKPPTWGRDGLASLVPESVAQGLIGHPFNCPDMIGGGWLGFFAEGEGIDQELFVRYAQCAALFPMMQFSLAPWRVLDDRHFEAVRAAVETRQALLDDLTELIDHAARTGEPILRPLAYHYSGYELVTDQFMLGEHILCAPVLTAGASSRHVRFPPGRWLDSQGAAVQGPTGLDIPVTLESMPWWRRSAAPSTVAVSSGNSSP